MQMRLLAGLFFSTFCCSISAAVAQSDSLHDLVKANDVASVTVLLDQGADLEESDFFVGTPLHVAVVQGNVEMAELLLERGADVETPSELNSSHPLHLAADFNDVAMVRLLVASGAELESRDAEGKTPLHRAVIAGAQETASELMRAGADVEAIEPHQGVRPLHYAAFVGHLDVLVLLLDAGAEIDSVSNDGATAIMWAAGNGNIEIIQELAARGADLQIRDNAGRSVIWSARFAANSDKVVKVLRDLGAPN